MLKNDEENMKRGEKESYSMVRNIYWAYKEKNNGTKC